MSWSINSTSYPINFFDSAVIKNRRPNGRRSYAPVCFTHRSNTSFFGDLVLQFGAQSPGCLGYCNAAADDLAIAPWPPVKLRCFRLVVFNHGAVQRHAGENP